MVNSSWTKAHIESIWARGPPSPRALLPAPRSHHALPGSERSRLSVLSRDNIPTPPPPRSACGPPWFIRRATPRTSSGSRSRAPPGARGRRGPRRWFRWLSSGRKRRTGCSSRRGPSSSGSPMNGARGGAALRLFWGGAGGRVGAGNSPEQKQQTGNCTPRMRRRVSERENRAPPLFPRLSAGGWRWRRGLCCSLWAG